ncbi:hypothetical protein VTO42DRAFT_8464 [Malbranchea cinnamomea]
MQPMPLFLRQSLRSGLNLTRASMTSRTSPLSVKPILSTAKAPPCLTSVCLRCQFRTKTRFYSTHDPNNIWKYGKETGGVNTETSEPVSAESGQPSKPQDLPASSVNTANEPGKNFSKTDKEGKNATGGSHSGLPSEVERRRSQFSKRFSDLMDKVQSNIFIAGRHLNDLTGYSAIEKLKQDILTQEERVRETRAVVRKAKEAYSAAINRRSASQREVNELLQRKHAWTPTDLERFTSLYRSDHANERAESEAQEALAAAERDAEEAAALLNKSILTRYHEEQIWSDKIRRMSTWGTWGLMGVNVLLFLVFQVAVEPWRRRRLVRGFEEKVREALEKENVKAPEPSVTDEGQALKSVSKADESVIPTVAPAAATTEETDPLAPFAEVEPITPETTAEFSAGEELKHEPVSAEKIDIEIQEEPAFTETPPPDSWSQYIQDLFSDRRVALSQRDLTTIALESAAAGAAFMGLLVAVFRPR